MPEYLIPIRPPREARGEIRKRLEKALAEVRDTDKLGRKAMVAHDAELTSMLERWPEEAPEGEDPTALWDEIKARFQFLAAKGPCLKCGTCCRTASPTLYEGDLELIEEGHLPKSALYSLRKGERAYSPRLREAAPVEQDLIKVRESADGMCAFLDDSLCLIHGHHPLQCKHLECWTGKHAGELSKTPRLGRRQLFADDETALALIEEYDAKLPAEELVATFEAAREEDEEAAARALSMIELDDRLRTGIAERFGYDREMQALLFGRDALLVSRAHGLVLGVRGDEPWIGPVEEPPAEDAPNEGGLPPMGPPPEE